MTRECKIVEAKEESILPLNVARGMYLTDNKNNWLNGPAHNSVRQC